MDGNAWDLVEEEAEESAEPSVGPSAPAGSTKRDSSVISTRSRSHMDDEANDEIAHETLNVGDNGARNFRRSKSPALDSLRKISRIVQQKFGLRALPPAASSSRRASADDAVATLTPSTELLDVPLDEWCARPAVSFYNKTPETKSVPQSETAGGKIVSSKTLERRQRPIEKKCAHLFDEAEASAAEAELADATQRAGAQPPGRRYQYDAYCPVHGSRRKLRRRHLIDMHDLVASVETAGVADNDDFWPILDSPAYLAKMLRKRQRAVLVGAEKQRADKEKHKIWVNLWIISFAFLFLFTGFNGLQNLQTTVNERMGSDSLGVFYVSLAVSSLFVPSFALNRLGTKMTLAAAIAMHILYMLANFVPRYYSLMPASVLAGVAASCLWAAKCVYITECGIKYAKLNVEARNVVIVRFFGYFFMIVHLSQVLGNVLSSLILGLVGSPPAPHIDRVDETCGHNFPNTAVLNATITTSSAESATTAMAGSLSVRALRNLTRPPPVAYLLVVGVYLCCALVALLIVLCFLNALRCDRVALSQEPAFSTRVLCATARNLRRPKLLLLIPLTVFNGIEQAFIVGMYTKAYVACGLGVAQIGYVMTSFGVADAICSLVFGPLIKLFGRMPLFVFGCVINMLMIMTLMIWPLNPGDRALFNAIAFVWGMADGVWNTQLNGFWVGLLGRESLELAFANYRFWMSSGLAAGFLFVCLTDVRGFLLVAFCCLLVGILGYLLLELYDMFINFLSAFAEQSDSKPDLAEKTDQVSQHTPKSNLVDLKT